MRDRKRVVGVGMQARTAHNFRLVVLTLVTAWLAEGGLRGEIIIQQRDGLAFSRGSVTKPTPRPPFERITYHVEVPAGPGLGSISLDTGPQGAQIGDTTNTSRAVVDAMIRPDAAADSLKITSSGSFTMSLSSDSIASGEASGHSTFNLTFLLTTRAYDYELDERVMVGYTGNMGGLSRVELRHSDPVFEHRKDTASPTFIQGSRTGTLQPGRQYSIFGDAFGFGAANFVPGVVGGRSSAGFTLRLMPHEPEVHWINAAGGLFQDEENWDPARLPDNEDKIVFERPGTYAVQLNGDVINDRMRTNGTGVNVTFDLGGHRYRARRFEGGGRAGDQVSITFKGGSGPVAAPPIPAAPGDGEIEFQEEFLVRPGVQMAYVDGVQGLFSFASVDGSLTVDEAGTNVNIVSSLNVGTDTTGSIDVKNGATLQSGFAVLGIDRVLPVLGGGDGTVVVRGQDAKWQVGLGLVVGEGGKGSVTALNGGAIDASQTTVTLAANPFSSGMLHVFGAGSSVKAQTLVVGDEGEGNMLVELGGTADAASVIVGGGPGPATSTGEGFVMVREQGSHLSMERLRIGELGEGTVVVSERGLLSPKGTFALASIGPKGKLEVRSRASARLSLLQSEGELVVADGGTLHTDNAILASSDSNATISGMDGPDSASWRIDSRLDILGSVTVADGGILSVADTMEVAAGGILRRTGNGSIDIGNVVGSRGNVTVGPGGTLSGGGTLTLGGGTLVISGGAQSLANVLPGNSPGTLTIDGNYRQEQFGVLGIEITGTAAGTLHDVLRVTGNAEMGGELVLKFIDGYVPRQGEMFEFLDVEGTLGGQFSDVEIRNLAPDFQFEVRSAGGAMTMVALNDGVFVPPPPSVWNVNAGGNWSNAANWTVDVPNAAGDVAVFGNKITAPRTVTVNVPVTVGRIEFASVQAYAIAGSQTITLNSQSIPEEINVTSGSHTISAPVSLADDTLITVAPAASNLSIIGEVSASGVDLSKAGAGKLTLSNLRAAGLSINAGTVAIAPNGTSTATSTASTLSIAGGATPTARLDLTNNAAIINYTGTSPAATVRAQILVSRGGAGLGATWTGQGITSSAAAAANAADAESRSVGYAENSALPLGPYTTFRGQPVDDTSLLMAFTRTGDANLDGLVNDDDVTIVGATYAPGVPQPSWALGDFDYNGFVDDDDVTLLGVFYDPSAAPVVAVPASAGAVAAIPEPGAVVLAGIALACLAIAAVVNRRPGCSW